MTKSLTVDPKRILIVGAGPGLGAAIARRFGDEGYAATLVARREAPLAGLADALRRAGISVDTVTADASNPHGFRGVLETVADRVTPGVVVYNAALIVRDGILTSDEDRLLASYAVNVAGAISAAQVFTPAMRQAGSGTFLATGGSPGVNPEPDHASLSLGKAGLRAALTLLHKELRAAGVHAASVRVVGAIAPGTPLAPERIAETFWALHTQPPADSTDETVFDGRQGSLAPAREGLGAGTNRT
jgi:short-subunit dehydrogenase